MITGCLLTCRSHITSQPVLYLADRPKLPAEPAIDSSRGQAVCGMEFSGKCMHGRTPYHAMDSREHGPWPSGHQLRILMHDGRRVKYAFQCQMQYTQNIQGAQPQSWLIKRRGNEQRCTYDLSMQANIQKSKATKWHTQCKQHNMHNALKHGIHNAGWTYTNMNGPQPHSHQ